MTELWYKIYEEIKPYVVKIETPGGFGTGFLFAYNENKQIAAIATALHVINDADKWHLPFQITQHSTGKKIFLEYTERAVIWDAKIDSAAIALPHNLFDFPDNTLPLLPADKSKKVGVQIGWVGFPALSPNNLCFFQGGVSAYVVDNNYYLIDGIAISGVSGGPVFAEKDESPQIIGIVSTYLYNRQPSGDTLPGLLMAYDLTHLYSTIARMESVDKARREKEQASQQQEPEPGPEPAPQEQKPPAE